MSNRRHRGLSALPFVAAVVFSAYSFFMPGSDLPPTDIWDKLGHALVFATLALTGLFAGIRASGLLAALFGYAVLTEVLQAVLPIQRDGDWHDVVADTVGILGAFLMVAAGSWISRAVAAPTSSAPRRGPW